VIVGTVAVNQRDSAPFGSQVSPSLDAGTRKQWETSFEEGKQAEAKEDAVMARRGYDQALKLDAGHAELMFRRARLAAGSGDTNAVAAFARARDLDTLRFRADTELNAVVRKVASKRESEGVWLMDAEATFAKNARYGVPGNEFFWEHVHFRLPGSYLLGLLTGAAVLEALPQTAKAGAAADWISLDDVAQRLAVTSWGDFRIVDGMRSRLRRPPFSTQAYAADREARFQKELAALAKGVQPTAFAAQAEVFRKRLTQRPDDWVLHDQLGRMHESFGDVDGAMAEWKKVIELMPHHFAVRLQMGRMLAAKDETAGQAEPLLREALAMRPATAEVHAVLGQALARQKKYAEAQAEFAFAARLRPDLLDAEVQWGIALAAEGKSAEARKHLERALEISTNSALAHLHLARLAVREGFTNAARVSYGEVLRLSPNYREAQEFLGGPPISP
jgi:tetratricopeptide (TPR) repeat protein